MEDKYTEIIQILEKMGKILSESSKILKGISSKPVDGLSVNESYFRGRKLEGSTMPIPQRYSGFVIGKKKLGKRKASGKSEEDSGSWETTAKFQNVTFWNHDSLPSQDDAFLRSFHWLAVAKALHQPVATEDLESASITP